MPAATLTQFWVHDNDDLSDYIVAYSRDRGDERGVGGEVRQYAAGRFRTVTREGVSRSIAAQLVNLTDTQVGWLEDRLGQVVMVRDHEGRKMFGSFFAMTVVDQRDRSGHDVTVQVRQITRAEEV
jgi:hypothetical protein